MLDATGAQDEVGVTGFVYPFRDRHWRVRL